MTMPEEVTITPPECMGSHTDSVSGYLTERVERRRLLREDLDLYQEEFGAFTDDEMAEAWAVLHTSGVTGHTA